MGNLPGAGFVRDQNALTHFLRSATTCAVPRPSWKGRLHEPGDPSLSADVSAAAPAGQPAIPGTTPRWSRLIVPTAVLLAALAAAAFGYVHFLQVSRHLWDGASHDRNAHYDFALQMASDLRLGRVVEFITELDSARMANLARHPCPTVLLGPGRISLGRFAETGRMGGRRVLRRPQRPPGGSAGRDLAGLVAALFVLVSPAYRAYATDVMLESLAAGLSMAALYGYLTTVQGRGASRGRPVASDWS